jgi:hypothetical protein
MAPATARDDHHGRRDHDRRRNHHAAAAHWPTASDAIRPAPPARTTAMENLLQQSGGALLNGDG